MQLSLADGRRMSQELFLTETTLKYAQTLTRDAVAPFDQMDRPSIITSLPHTLDMTNLAAKKPSINGMTAKAIRARLADPQYDDRTVRVAHEILYRAIVKACQVMRKQVDASSSHAMLDLATGETA